MKYASRMKYSALPNVIYFRFCENVWLGMKYRVEPYRKLRLLEPYMSASRTWSFSFIFVA